MSIKSKVLATAATLTLVGGVGAAGVFGASTASAATPSCGANCINLYSHQFSSTTPNYTVDVLRQGEKTGQPIILFRQANYDPALDWTVAYQGNVSDFFAAGLVSASVNLHYGCNSSANACTNTAFPNDPAFENEYAPFGVDSGLCMGVAATAFSDEGVTLQPCGVSSKTVWILDTYDQNLASITSLTAFDEAFTSAAGVPLINGSDTNFSQPFVLTYPANGFPTDMPRPQLVVTNLTGFSNGTGGPEVSTVSSSQLFGATFGVLP